MKSIRQNGLTRVKRPAPYEDAPPPNLKQMTNSERGKYYRRRRKLYGAELERRVRELKDEIAELTISRQVQHELALSQRRTPLGSAAHIVDEYCKLFSHGTPVRLAVNENDASATLVSRASSAQRGFLNAVMNDNVRFGEFLGVELLLDQWERYSLFHASISWTMKSLDIIQMDQTRMLTGDNQDEDGPLLISITADLTVRFSRRTIEEVFPHLVGDEALTQSLIGLEVTYPSINHFHFNKQGKIEWYAPEADFVDALMTALKNPILVDRVLNRALIAKNHMIGVESDGRQPAVVDEALADNNASNLDSSCNTDYGKYGATSDAWPSYSKLQPEDVAIVRDDEPAAPACFLADPRHGLDFILG